MLSFKQLASNKSKQVLEKSENIHEDLAKLSADVIKEFIKPMSIYYLFVMNKNWIIETTLNKHELSLILLKNSIVRKILKDKVYYCLGCNSYYDGYMPCECKYVKKKFEDLSDIELLHYIDCILTLKLPEENGKNYSIYK